MSETFTSYASTSYLLISELIRFSTDFVPPTLDHALDHIPRETSTDSVLDIIRHADKYDCYDVLTLSSQVYGWLKSDHLTLGKDLVNILAVSYLVRDREAFTNASKALVSKYDGSFADLADDIICEVLPWKTFCK